MTDLFAYCKDISSCPCIKQSHLGNVGTRNCVLQFWLMTKPSEIQSISHQYSVTLLVMLKYLICVRFLQNCCSPVFVLTWKSLVAESYTSRKLQDYEYVHGRNSFMGDSFYNFKKISGRSFSPFSPAISQNHTWTATLQWSYSCKKV